MHSSKTIVWWRIIIFRWMTGHCGQSYVVVVWLLWRLYIEDTIHCFSIMGWNVLLMMIWFAIVFRSCLWSWLRVQIFRIRNILALIFWSRCAIWLMISLLQQGLWKQWWGSSEEESTCPGTFSTNLSTKAYSLSSVYKGVIS